VTARANGALIRFGRLSQLNRTTYRGAFDGSRDFSRRTSGMMSYGVQSDLTDRSRTIAGDGPLLGGLVAERLQGGTMSVLYRATPRTSAGLSGRHQQVSYDTPGFLGGSLVNVGADV
jgi:hypothetical protein